MPKISKSKKENMSPVDEKALNVALKAREARVSAQKKAGMFDKKSNKKAK